MLGRPFAELKWRYHYIETGESGRRAKLFVSEITVEATPAAEPSWLFC